MNNFTGILIALLFLLTGFAKSQSIPALINQQGDFIIANQDVPPFDLIDINELTSVLNIVSVDQPHRKEDSNFEVISFSMTIVINENSSFLAKINY